MAMYSRFLRDDSGAVTVDWVPLTAGVLLVGIIVVYAIFNTGVDSLVDDTNSTMTSIMIDVDPGTAAPQNQ
jgi:Flp pilus assembly pilin Flp